MITVANKSYFTRIPNIGANIAIGQAKSKDEWKSLKPVIKIFRSLQKFNLELLDILSFIATLDFGVKF